MPMAGAGADELRAAAVALHAAGAALEAAAAALAAQDAPGTPDRLLSVAEAAQAMGVQRSTFYEHVLPELRTIHVGRRVLVPAGAVTDYVKSRDGRNGHSLGAAVARVPRRVPALPGA